LAIDGHNRLMRLDAVGEERLEDGSCSPLPLALAVAAGPGGILVVWSRTRGHWELPGGMIERGERPRDAAIREFAEETGQQATSLRCVGVATYQLGPGRRLEHGAIFRVTIGPEQPFTPNDEIEKICWWDRSSAIDVDPLDATVATFALSR
jgi:8-oxo-dGTP diphosphatase